MNSEFGNYRTNIDSTNYVTGSQADLSEFKSSGIDSDSRVSDIYDQMLADSPTIQLPGNYTFSATDDTNYNIALTSAPPEEVPDDEDTKPLLSDDPQATVRRPPPAIEKDSIPPVPATLQHFAPPVPATLQNFAPPIPSSDSSVADAQKLDKPKLKKSQRSKDLLARQTDAPRVQAPASSEGFANRRLGKKEMAARAEVLVKEPRPVDKRKVADMTRQFIMAAAERNKRVQNAARPIIAFLQQQPSDYMLQARLIVRK